ncbi:MULTISPECIES: phage tail tape measure protein [Eubacteriales]|uniref:phage tail tape measure protein n=1 Tax=Eubacteriales TaxID=186802 RepID=UPI002A8AD3F7|nr:phage tail tape measure protein [Dysosmobacter sp.]MCI7660317.1 phage tail tape measure protein [Flintibacter sp.]MDY4180740.1 phage tail tape measure protein [Pseudoflavonifractor sp.]MDY5511113.1 phage tail tape measure protein [Dysosmobacter sp.]
MSLESVFKLSLVMNMIDNLSGPMAGIASKVGVDVTRLDSLSQAFGSAAKAGAVMQEMGTQIAGAALAPVEATFETRRAIGELASLGVRDLGAVEDAARSFSDQWAGTTKADFISAAYDIKSGIASLSDEGVAEFTSLAALTAKATKSTAGEMTSLFATGYGIYKSYYDDLSDLEFGEIFLAGIAESVRAFKTSGSGMAQAIQTLGASATTAQVPLEEQLSVLGMLQATMGGSEAGTKYKAFLRSAAKGGEALGLSFLDANNQLLSMPEILDILRGKFGETMDAAEKMELQKAFGDTEAVALIDLMYSKVGDLEGNILSLYDAMGQGTGVTQKMASAIQETEPERYERLRQQIHNVTEAIGNSLLPTINDAMAKGSEVLTKAGTWIENNQELVRAIMLVVLTLGGFLAVAGTVITVVSGVGLIITRTISGFKLLKAGFLLAKGALTPLIASVWSFTAALLANPVTWIVIGIVALIAALVLLYNKCEWFRDGVNAVLGFLKEKLLAIPGAVVQLFQSIVTGITTKITAAREAVSNGIKGVKEIITGAVSWFFESGKKIVTTFANGIKSAFTGAVDTVKGGLQKIRNLLPFSDAKEGPLSTLTLSGQRTMTTYAHGLKLAQDAPAEAAEQGLKLTRARLEREPVRKITLGPPGSGKDGGEESAGSGGSAKQVIIQKVIIPADLKTIKDLRQLLEILKELESYAEANEDAEDDGDPDAALQPA